MIVNQKSLNTFLSFLSGRDLKLRKKDYPDLVSLACDNELAGTVLYLLKGDKRLPLSLRKKLQERVHIQTGMELFREQAIQKLAATFEQARILYVPLKGSCYRYLLYPDPVMRPSVDIDVLVPRGSLEEAEKALLENGFVTIDQPIDRPMTKQVAYERKVVLGNIQVSGSSIDLHDAFVEPSQYPFDYQALWTRVVGFEEFAKRIGYLGSGSLFGPAARFFTPEDSMVHQIIHTAGHMFHQPLRSLIDTKLIVEQWKPDWNLVLERVISARAATVGYFHLSIVKDLLKVEIPDDVLERLRPSRLRQAWIDLFIKRRPVLPKDGQSGPLRFFPLTDNARLQQALLMLPLMDGWVGPVKFVTRYGALRVADFVVSKMNR